MRLLIIRHAIAVPRGTPGIPDDERPLTPRGEKRFRKSARGLARIAPRPQAILTSPLLRALTTAEMAAKEWRLPKPLTEPTLADGNIEKLLGVLESYPEDALLALVGHEPFLSELLARLLGCSEGPRLTFRKGGAALVELDGGPADGGRLVWYLPPKLLRILGRH